MLAAPIEDGPDDDVGGEPEDRNGEHQAALDRLGRLEPQEGLVADDGRDDPERDPVQEGGEDLEAPPAEGAPGRHGTPGEPEGEEAEAERRDVGEHVPRVGEKGQAAAEKAADDLDDEHGRRDDKGDLQRPLMCRDGMCSSAQTSYIFSRAAMRSSMGGWVLKSRLTPPLMFLSGLTM